jgi:S1-C subfamily serine protease
MAEAPTSSNSRLVIFRRYQRPILAAVVIFILGSISAIHKSSAVDTQGTSPEQLQKQVHDLSLQVQMLMEERRTPAEVVDRYRNSIGYIYGSYHVGFANRPPEIRARVSGTGFLVSEDLVATNRHVVEPWYGDSDAQTLIRHGANPVLEDMVILFPGSLTPVPLRHPSLSKTADLAVLRARKAQLAPGLPPLPLAQKPPAAGEPVVVIGYPLGIFGMIAKSPSNINQRLADESRDMNIARKLAQLSLIRPLISCGHLGDVIGDKLVYDAATAHGGSGGPVFNSRGEVIAVNSAYMDGFSGGSIGVAVEFLRPLLEESRATNSATTDVTDSTNTRN